MTSSVARDVCLSAQNTYGERIILSNATLHERGVMLCTYRNMPGECIPCREEYAIIQNGTHPAQAESRTGGRIIPFTKRPRTLSLVPPGFAPDVRLLAASKLVLCLINENVIRQLMAELDHQPSSLPVFKSGISDNAITDILALMTQEFKAGSPLGTLYAETLAHALAIRLVHVNSTPDRTSTSATSPLPPNILKRIKELIEAELGKDLSLEVLASDSGYSRAHFLRMFRVSTGTTPHRYVLERRIDRAQQLLQGKGASLADIAADCGFSSQTHMTDVFRRNLNTTPREYRQRKWHESRGAALLSKKARGDRLTVRLGDSTR
jgi:AraC family transcriptional regulator